MRGAILDLCIEGRGKVTVEILVEQQRLLEEVSATYRRDSEQDNRMRELCIRTMRPWMSKTDSVLEVGCSDGFMTEMLSGMAETVDVVEASARFAELARHRGLPNVSVHHGMVESYVPHRRFDKIALSWVLTHVLDASQLLQTLRGWLSERGLMFVVVPNARVLSRQLALHMGLVDDLYQLTENDRKHGHKRVYDRVTLRRQLEGAGFDVVSECGLMLKPLADFQMDQLYERGVLVEEHIEGLFRLRLEYPDSASAIFCVCRAK